MSNTSLSYLHRGGDTPLIGSTLDRYLRGVASHNAARDAVVSIPQGVRLSYAELDAAVEDLARGLVALGVEKGDRVGIWSTDNVEWIELQLATARIGAVLVNINPAYRSTELRHALRLAEVQTLFLIPSFRSSRYTEMVCEVCARATTASPAELAADPDPKLPWLRHLVAYDPENVAATGRPASGFMTWTEVVDGGRAVTGEQMRRRAESLNMDDPINIQFTSGTTGAPKAVVLTHHSILNNAYFAGRVMKLSPDDRLCVPLPFYHCFGMVVSTLAMLACGGAIVIPAPHFDAGATLAAIEQERCTVLHGVPTMFIAQLEREDFDDFDLSSLRTGIMGGAPCPPEVMRRVIEVMGCRDILIGYGQTETSPLTHLTRSDDSFDKRVRTVGTNLPHQEVKVIDVQTGVTVPIGEPGEICFRGYHLMRGYYGQPDATAAAIDEAGWLHSGDIGVLDTDGYLTITGRLKDMIIRGGENIYPAEVEALLHEHPAIAQVAVFGIPDEKMGEEVGAWIRLNESARADPADLRAWARENMAHYKVPRFIWLVDEFPMTVTGKVQKFRIREIAAEQVRQGEVQPA